MLIHATKERLALMLDDAGVSPSAMTAADVRTVVDVFHGFAVLPVDDAAQPEEDGDGVLAQFGTFDFRGRFEFSVGFTRQLIEGGGDDSPIWQLGCTLHWPASADTESLASGNLWSFGKTLDEFFTDAVALPGWAWALKCSTAPQDLAITFEEL
jgi:hypothetical protein